MKKMSVALAAALLICEAMGCGARDSAHNAALTDSVITDNGGVIVLENEAVGVDTNDRSDTEDVSASDSLSDTSSLGASDTSAANAAVSSVSSGASSTEAQTSVTTARSSSATTSGTVDYSKEDFVPDEREDAADDAVAEIGALLEKANEAKNKKGSDSSASDSSVNPELVWNLYEMAARAILSKNFEDNYEIISDYKTKTLTVNIWQDGIADCAHAAQAGDASSKQSWNKMKDRLSTVSTSVYEGMEVVGLDNTDAVITVNVLSDKDHSIVLMTYTNGKLVTDVVG